MHGSLFQQVEKTIDFLTTKYTKAYIRYEGLQRIDELPIPRDALREAILNALIHKDYSSFTPIQISVYDDKVMIWNTAILPADWTVETLTQKHGSRPHNPDIAATFFRAGEVEAWGQGIERIQTYCADYGCPVPEWRFDGAGIWTIFYNKPNTNTAEKSSEKNVEESSQKTTQKTTQKIIELIKDNQNISIEEMADKCGLTRDGIKYQIKKLKQEGILRRIGPDKGGHWEIVQND